MRLASSSNKIICHDWPSGKILTSYEGPQNSTTINSISWSKESSWLVFVPDVGTTKIISLHENAKRLLDIADIQQPTCAAFQHQTKRKIAIGNSTGSILLYDVKTKKISKQFKQAPSKFFKIQYLIGDRYLVGGCVNGEVYVYNCISSQTSCIFKVPNSKTLTNFKIHPLRTNLLAGCSEEGIVTIWDINSSKSIMSVKTHNLPVSDIAYNSTQPNILMCVGMDRRICLIDATTSKITSDVSADQVPTAVDFNPDGNSFAVGFQNGLISSYDMRNLKETILQTHDHNKSINQLLFESTGDYTDGDTIMPEESSNTIEIKSENDSINTLLCSDVLADIKEEEDNSTPKSNNKDSFLEAMGINNSSDSSTYSNKRKSITDDVKRWIDTRANFNATGYNASPSFIEENKQPSFKIHLDVLKNNKISTPTNNENDAPPQAYYSPILNPISFKNIAQIVRDAVKEEMKDFKQELIDLKQDVHDLKQELSDFKKDFKYDLYNIGTAGHRQYLNLQMSIVKQSIKVEDQFGQLRQDLSSPDE